jgi:hypothetical protein
MSRVAGIRVANVDFTYDGESRLVEMAFSPKKDIEPSDVFHAVKEVFPQAVHDPSDRNRFLVTAPFPPEEDDHIKWTFNKLLAVIKKYDETVKV